MHIAEMHAHHICRTDVYVHSVPFIPPQTEDTEMQGAYQQSRTKGILVVCVRVCLCVSVCAGLRCVCVLGGLLLKLRWGNFSPVIALCGTSPGGTMSAAEGGHIMIHCPRSPWPKCQTQQMKIWHIVQRPCGRYTKGCSSFSQSRTLNLLFISQDDGVIY